MRRAPITFDADYGPEYGFAPYPAGTMAGAAPAVQMARSPAPFVEDQPTNNSPWSRANAKWSNQAKPYRLARQAVSGNPALAGAANLLTGNAFLGQQNLYDQNYRENALTGAATRGMDANTERIRTFTPLEAARFGQETSQQGQMFPQFMRGATLENDERATRLGFLPKQLQQGLDEGQLGIDAGRQHLGQQGQVFDAQKWALPYGPAMQFMDPHYQTDPNTGQTTVMPNPMGDAMRARFQNAMQDATGGNQPMQAADGNWYVRGPDGKAKMVQTHGTQAAPANAQPGGTTSPPPSSFAYQYPGQPVVPGYTTGAPSAAAPSRPKAPAAPREQRDAATGLYPSQLKDPSVDLKALENAHLPNVQVTMDPVTGKRTARITPVDRSPARRSESMAAPLVNRFDRPGGYYPSPLVNRLDRPDRFSSSYYLDW